MGIPTYNETSVRTEPSKHILSAKLRTNSPALGGRHDLFPLAAKISCFDALFAGLLPWSRHGLLTLRQTNIAALVPSGDCLPRAGFNMLATFLMKFVGLQSLAVRHSWYQSGTVAYLKQALGMHRQNLGIPQS